MKKIALIAAFALLFSGTANAQMVSTLCVKSGVNCPPVSSAAPLPVTLNFAKQSAAPTTAPGAGLCIIFWVAGTNAGSGKLQAECGTSNTPTTIIDNVGNGF